MIFNGDFIIGYARYNSGYNANAYKNEQYKSDKAA